MKSDIIGLKGFCLGVLSRLVWENELILACPCFHHEGAKVSISGKNRRSIISHLMAMTPLDFEKFVGDLFRKMGYETEVTRPTADGGVDLKVLLETPAGDIVRYAVQVKRYQSPVGVREIRELLGSMTAMRYDKCIFVTTSSFTKDGKELAEDSPLSLIDGSRLSELVMAQGLIQPSEDTVEGSLDFEIGVQKRLLAEAEEALEQNRYIDAMSILGGIPEESEHYKEALRLRASAHIHMSDYKVATKILNRALELDENDAETWYLLGMNFGKMNLLSKSIEFLARAHYLDQTNPRYRIEKAAILLKAGRVPEALDIAMEYMAESVEDRSIQFQVSNVLAVAGRHSLAVQVLNEVISRDPDFIEAYRTRGALRLHALRDYRGAIADFRKCLQFRPKEATIWGFLGMALTMIRKYYEAQSCFMEMMRFSTDEKNREQADSLLGTIQMFLDNPDPALRKKMRDNIEKQLLSSLTIGFE
jgi:tetratricopeptide (TPR) repeat protein